MNRKTMITNEPTEAGRQQLTDGFNKQMFCNFLDNGDIAELQLFGTIQSD